MPKKFDSENSKAAAARARKDAVKQAEQQKKEAAYEDALWEDNDKHATKKLQRKADAEKKRMELLEKKATLKTLADQELEAISKADPKRPSGKVTQLQIQAEKEKREAAVKASQLTKATPTKLTETPIPENINRLTVDGEVARTVEEAIHVLKISEGKEDVERHPEKRMKAAHTAFEEKHMPRIRAENPNLRLSQVKQILHKEWLKSPENPLNAAHVCYNEK